MKSLDSRDYYKDLINHYGELLNDPFWNGMKTFIQDEQRLCIHKLNKIKEADIEAILLTEKLSRFLFTE
jgi:hypothetical protein|tara:strand:+ start:797 stop:1003 length:207 start_codon:yes stop_codon:yes gene_type:complete